MGMKPDGMRQEIYERYQADGFTEEDIKRIWKDTLYFRAKAKERQGKEPREITSSTYKRAEKRLHKEVSDWFGRGR